MEKPSNFFLWLQKASLENYHKTLLENGISEITHLQDVNEDDALGFGFTKFQFRRMQRHLILQGEVTFAGFFINMSAFLSSLVVFYVMSPEIY